VAFPLEVYSVGLACVGLGLGLTIRKKSLTWTCFFFVELEIIGLPHENYMYFESLIKAGI